MKLAKAKAKLQNLFTFDILDIAAYFLAKTCSRDNFCDYVVCGRIPNTCSHEPSEIHITVLVKERWQKLHNSYAKGGHLKNKIHDAH